MLRVIHNSCWFSLSLGFINPTLIALIYAKTTIFGILNKPSSELRSILGTIVKFSQTCHNTTAILSYFDSLSKLSIVAYLVH